MKLFKRKDRLEEKIKSQETAMEAFIEKLEMLNRVEREGDWFRRWQILYNELRPIDIILLIAIKLFFCERYRKEGNGMKLNIQTIKGVSFSEILIGECFVHAGNYFIKTDINTEGNAVKLKTGEHYTFMSQDKVLPVEAEVHICRKEEDNVKS